MSQIPRWTAAALAVLFLTTGAAQALPASPPPAAPEPAGWLDTLLAWLTGYPNGVTGDEGWGMGPNGIAGDEGWGMDPNGLTSDEGVEMDPNG